MHVPPAFVEPRADRVLGLVERHHFAALVHAAAPGDVSITHAPVMLRDRAEGAARVEGAVLLTHVARGNPLVRRLRVEPRLTIAALGPSHYVTPDWYETPGVVPTWNYAAVHLHCEARAFEDRERLLDLFDRIAAVWEPAVGGGWRRDDERQAMVDALIRGVVGYELTIRSHEAIFKMSQNKTLEDRRGVVAGLHALPGERAQEVAAMTEAYLAEAAGG